MGYAYVHSYVMVSNVSFQSAIKVALEDEHFEYGFQYDNSNYN